MREPESLVMETIQAMVLRRTGSPATITLDSDMISDLEMDSLEIAELSAVLDHQKARAALLRATGRLLEARHIVLE